MLLLLFICIVVLVLLFVLLIYVLNQHELMARIIWDEDSPVEYGPFSSFQRLEVWKSVMFEKYGEKITEINYFYRKTKKPSNL